MDKSGWFPKVGEKVIYQRLRRLKGLEAPPLDAQVVALYKSGDIGIRIKGKAPRAVKLEALKPLG